jgi:two-component system cell cycle sensor histidine kinase/response regulator CckA
MLPRYVEKAGEELPPEVKKAPKHADLTGSACVLLVEDEEAVRAFAARALASRGYTVHEASTGTEALELIDEIDEQIDLVISDVMMPEMDGPTLLKKLRETQPDLKIIFVSGYAEDAFAKNLEEGEKFSFLPKPFSLKQLATAVKEVLDDA